MVGNTDEKPIIGIVGGVGSGKSTVAAEFGRQGCFVISADEIAHEALEKKPIRDKIVSAFGSSVVDRRGRIDRGKLAEVAFSAEEKLSLLNRIVHPYVLSRVEELIEFYKHWPGCKAIVVDMPLLFEVGWQERCDYVFFVSCERSLRVERAFKGGKLDRKALEVREKFQICLDRKARLSDNIIDNNSDISSLASQVGGILAGLSGK